MSLVKYIIGGGIAFFAGRYLINLTRAGNKAVTMVNGKIDRITPQGVDVSLSYNIKNPTRSSLRMTPPLIKLSHQGKVLASSSMKTVDIPADAKDSKGRIKILPHNETGEISTLINIPYLNLVGVGIGLWNKINDPNQSVKLTIESNATLYTSVGVFPYDDITNIEL